jgi:hypothetical protein
VGLIQRVVEKEGISTISISLSKEITQTIRVPRAVYSDFPLGHLFSYPGQKSKQLMILRFLLKCLAKIDTPGTIIDLDLSELSI